METIIGVISDTHGLLRPEALAALAGSHLIIHAGDVGGDGTILDRLAAIAPVHAVCGNIDGGPLAARLPPHDLVEAGGRLFYVLHDIADLDLDPPTAGFAAVIYGHSHQPSIKTRDGVLYLNPGSAGPRRFKLPIALARITVSAEAVRPEIIEIVPS